MELLHAGTHENACVCSRTEGCCSLELGVGTNDVQLVHRAGLLGMLGWSKSVHGAYQYVLKCVSACYVVLLIIHLTRIVFRQILCMLDGCQRLILMALKLQICRPRPAHLAGNRRRRLR